MHPIPDRQSAKLPKPPYDEVHDAHLRPLIAGIPDWLGTASAAKRQAFGRQAPFLPPKLKTQPDVRHQALMALNATHWRAQNDVEKRLEHLQDASAFAEPLLKAELKKKFDLDVDVRTTFVRLYIPAKTPWFPIKTGARAWTVSLLDAALHNFELAETEDDAYEPESTFITQPDAGGQFETLPSLKARLSIVAFTKLCRELDIGARYQTYLREALGSSHPVAAAVLRHKIDASQKAAMQAALQWARMSGDISEDYFLRIEALLDATPVAPGDWPALKCQDLSMLETPLTGIVVFAPELLEPRTSARVVAYIPDDPEHPVKEYASPAEMYTELTRQLRFSDYQKFFSRFVNLEQRGVFFATLNARLSEIKWHEPVAGSSEPPWRETPLEQPKLQLTVTPISAPLWQHLYQSKLNKILNDAAIIAVPTATVDQKVRWAFWDSVVNIVSTILQTVAFIIAPFVPGLGELMMAYMAYQLLDEVFEGIIAWAQGRTTEAFTYLMGTLESLVQLGTFAIGGAIGAGEFRKVLPAEIVEFIDRFKPVQMPGGQTKYWEPNLTRYEHTASPAANSAPNELGLHAHEGRQLLTLDNAHFAVSETTDAGEYRIAHPTQADAYQPWVRHNGEGAWYSEIEQPLTWDRPTALRRIGHSVESFSAAQRETILQVSGLDEEVLRTMHVDQETVPPLLADSIQRFRIDQDLQRFADDLHSESPEAYLRADPVLQLQLLTEQGRWPKGQRLRLLDPAGELVWQSSSDESLPLTTLAQGSLKDGDLLKTLLSFLDEQQAKALLGESFAGPTLALDVRSQKLRQQLAQIATQQRTSIFESRYDALQRNDDPLANLLAQHDSGLPASVTRELLGTATGEELMQISEGQLPPRQQALMQLANQELRVTRAYEGLVLDSVNSPDTDTLALHSLKRLPGWSGEVRLEIRDGHYEGRLVDSTGSVEAPVQKVLVRQSDGTYQPYDERGQELHSATDLYSGILYALPDSERQNLSVQIGQGDSLKAAIRKRPMERSELRLAISPVPIPEPTVDTLRLVGRGGRSGGAGIDAAYSFGAPAAAATDVERVRAIFPTFTPEDARAFAARFQHDRAGLSNELSRLRTEFSRLKDDLRRWKNEAPVNDPDTGVALTDIQRRAAAQNRALFMKAVEGCWRREPGGADTYMLQILEPVAGELPTLHADFSHVTMLSFKGSAGTRGVERFLQHFPSLRYLDMHDLNVPDLPQSVAHMPNLQHLALRNCGIRLSTADSAGFPPMEQLSILDLQDNPLGVPPDISTLPALHYLNLDNTGIATTPPGLLDHPNLFTGKFDGNQITEIPEELLTSSHYLTGQLSFTNNPLSAASRESVKTLFNRTQKNFGVTIEPADIHRTTELFPALSAEQANDLLYKLPGTLAEGRSQLANWEAEVTQLRTELAQWKTRIPEHSASHGQPLNLNEQVSERLAREDFADKMEHFWRNRSPRQPGARDSHLVATLEFMGDMPVLSADFSHVNRLTFNGNKSITAMSPFLQRFKSLTILELRSFDLEPDFLPTLDLPRLTALELKSCGFVLTPENQAALLKMNQIEILELSDNPLGALFDLNLLPMLTSIDLSLTGINELPPRLLDLPELHIAVLRDNFITELPEAIFKLPLDRTRGFDFADNPLSTESRNRIKTYFRETSHDFEVSADTADVELARELFPSLDVQDASNMIYALPGTLAEGRIQLQHWQAERETLRADLSAWTTQGSTHHPVTGEARTPVDFLNDFRAREDFREQILRFWESRSDGTGTRNDFFEANLGFSGDMPRLTVDFSHVLTVDFTGNPGITEVGGFLEHFPYAQVVEMRDFALGQMPDNLTRLTELKELSLINCGITLTADGQSALESLGELELLDLRNNPLGVAPDVETMPQLNDLRLSNTGISGLPDGLTDHPNLRDVRLDGNRIVELPDTFFEVLPELADGINLAGNPLSASSRNRIKGHYHALNNFGVFPERADIAKAKALFPALKTKDAVHMIYSLPGSLAAGSAQLLRWEAEIATMISDLAQWAERIPPRDPSTGRFLDAFERATQHFARTDFSRELQTFWRSRHIDKPEIRSNIFVAELRFSGDMPTLTADFSHVAQLSLLGNDALKVSDGFLSGFRRLQALELRTFALGRIPPALNRMPTLKSLVLSSCGIVFDAEGQAALSSLSQLRALDLHNNPLVEVPDVSALPEMMFLDLSKTSIDRIPPGLSSLPNLEDVMLNENNISELPDELLNLPADVAQSIDLHDNPISAVARERIKVCYQTSGYTFSVPVEAMDRELALTLYPDLTDSQINELVYSLPGTLADGHVELVRRTTELATLTHELDLWANETPLDPASRSPLTGEALRQEQANRQSLKQSLENCWRRIVAQGQNEFEFNPDVPVSGDLPTLTADFAHVRTVFLVNGSGAPSRLGEFLKLFPNAEKLAIQGYQLNDVAAVVSSMEKLTALSLSGCHITLTPASVEMLATRSNLNTLILRDNPLGLSPDLSRLEQLSWLDLSNTGISEPPLALPVERLEYVNFSNNAIVELPENFWNARTTEFDFSGNPLSAHSAQHLESYRLRRIAALAERQTQRVPTPSESTSASTETEGSDMSIDTSAISE
ncbi:dermonecrotic toxin domain-containing protein [Pseudomonas iridis]|uniref:dermonecrotic toxin domain-containing protein n=1 Tax=Pseudomonas iridis TaxID=2710587 RepID=UPI0037C893AC